MASPAAPHTAALITSDLSFVEQAILKDDVGCNAGEAANAMEDVVVAVVVLDVGLDLDPHLTSSSVVDGNADTCSRQAKTP